MPCDGRRVQDTSCYLVEVDRLSVDEAREAAHTAIPRTMLDLIRRGEDGPARVRRVSEFLDRTDAVGLADLRSPTGDRIAYDKGQVALLRPLQVYRALNIGANYDACLTMRNHIEG